MESMEATLEIVTGPMFAGKSTDLVRRLSRLQRANQKVGVFHHEVDDRSFRTHDGFSYTSQPFGQMHGLPSCENREFDWILLDEVQFVPDPHAEGFCNALKRFLKANTSVVCYGLDQKADGEPWPTTMRLMSIADKVTKLTAICQCGMEATMTQRIIPGDSGSISVGGSEAYRPVCRKCHDK